MDPLVSVIIPTYNYAEYITKAINSVLEQTYKNFEIIIIDDGSTDNTKEIIENYIKKYPDKIKYFFQRNRGCEVACNKGIRESQGSYIALLGADDIWLPEKLKIQINLFDEDSDIGFIHTNHDLFTDEGRMINFKFGVKSKKFLSGYIFPYLLRECFIRGSTVIVKKECLNEIGLFDETLSDDYELWLRISRKYRAGYIDKPLVMCLEHPEQVHRLDFNRTYQTVQKTIEKTLQTFPEVKNEPQIKISLAYRKSKTHFELGYHLFCQNELEQARKEFKISLKHKFIILTFIYYLLTFLGSLLLPICRKLKRQLMGFYLKF